MAEKKKMIEPASLLSEMEEMERWNGATKEKIVDNWYDLKRRVAAVIASKEEKEEEDGAKP